jgi:hypothetical protein
MRPCGCMHGAWCLEGSQRCRRRPSKVVATQVPAFMGYKSAQAASLAGVIVCLATLVVYCIFQARPPAGWASEPRTVRTCPASCWGGLTRIPCFLPGLRAHVCRSEGAVHTRCQCIALVWWGLSTSAAAPACAGTGPPAASGGAGAACQADAAASPSGTSCSSARCRPERMDPQL